MNFLLDFRKNFLTKIIIVFTIKVVTICHLIKVANLLIIKQMINVLQDFWTVYVLHYMPVDNKTNYLFANSDDFIMLAFF